MCRCGTSVYDLVGLVVLGGWLDLVILEVFCNLWFYDSNTQKCTNKHILLFTQPKYTSYVKMFANSLELQSLLNFTKNI